jgi:hypothetical protein
LSQIEEKQTNCQYFRTGFILLLGSAVAPFTIEKLGRKPILLFSAAGMFISLVIIYLNFQKFNDFINQKFAVDNGLVLLSGSHWIRDNSKY